MINFKLIGMKLGEGLKHLQLREIDKIAKAIFDFSAKSHPNSGISNLQSQHIYNWVLTLGEQSYEEERKEQLLQDFINELTPEGSPLRKLQRETAKLPEFDFWDVIHKSIVVVAKQKFEDGYYADSVESAFKEINTLVKEIVRDKTGEELDGAKLMFTAFSPNNPIILLADLFTQTGKDIQEGYMHIFAGAMRGIRNPKAHENITIDIKRATHFIFLASLLICKLDEAT